MVANTGYEGPAEALALYETLVAGTPGAQLKGATMPYTSRNGHMFSFLDPSGAMALRLPPDRRADFVATYATGAVEQHGRVMKEYVEVPAGLLANTDELREWFDHSYAWVGTLKPKATARS